MFYTVFARDFGLYQVVRANWISNNCVVKHINNGLNHNQSYRCFYTTNPAAYNANDGSPREDYPVNHSLDLQTTGEFPDGEFCFRCQLKQCFGTFKNN